MVTYLWYGLGCIPSWIECGASLGRCEGEGVLVGLEARVGVWWLVVSEHDY